MKTIQQRIRIEQDDLETVKKMADSSRLGQVDVMTMVLAAGLRAIRENGECFRFPLRFRLESESFQKTERPAAPAAPAPAKARKP